MINWNHIIEFIVFVGIYETGKFLFKVIVRSFKEMVPDVTTKPFERFNFENKKISQPPKPSSALTDVVNYEFMKQDQWNAMCNQWEKANYTIRQDDSIDLNEQLKRLEGAKKFWERELIYLKKEALMQVTNESFMSYSASINDATLRIKRYEKQIENLNAFSNDMFRKVGNYEKNNT